MNQKAMSRPHTQQGAILIIAMIMLMLITMVSIGLVRSSTMNEKMAGNSRDRDKAFQAAEAAVRSCLSELVAGTYVGSSPTQLTPATSPSVQVWDDPANWTSSTNSKAITVDSTGLAAQPRCMFEVLGAGSGSYRITGRAVGASSQTVVMLQATYSAE
ncbi:MAG: PilX N-terminal domain-containing pilus assembly protein [Rhizobacter sp.]